MEHISVSSLVTQTVHRNGNFLVVYFIQSAQQSPFVQCNSADRCPSTRQPTQTLHQRRETRSRTSCHARKENIWCTARSGTAFTASQGEGQQELSRSNSQMSMAASQQLPLQQSSTAVISEFCSRK